MGRECWEAGSSFHVNPIVSMSVPEEGMLVKIATPEGGAERPNPVKEAWERREEIESCGALTVENLRDTNRLLEYYLNWGVPGEKDDPNPQRTKDFLSRVLGWSDSGYLRLSFDDRKGIFGMLKYLETALVSSVVAEVAYSLADAAEVEEAAK